METTRKNIKGNRYKLVSIVSQDNHASVYKVFNGKIPALYEAISHFEALHKDESRPAFLLDRDISCLKRHKELLVSDVECFMCDEGEYTRVWDSGSSI